MVENTHIPRVSVHRIEADRVIVFSREAGPADGLVVLTKSFAAAAEYDI